MHQQSYNGSFRMPAQAYNGVAPAYNSGASGFQGQPAQGSHMPQPQPVLIMYNNQYPGQQPGFVPGMPYMMDPTSSSAGASQMGRQSDVAAGCRPQYSQHQQGSRMMYPGVEQSQPGQQSMANSMPTTMVLQNGGMFSVPVLPTAPMPGQTASTLSFSRSAAVRQTMPFNHATAAGGGGAQPTGQGASASYIVGGPQGAQYYKTPTGAHVYQTSTQMNLAGTQASNGNGSTQPPAPRRERKPLLIVNPDTDAVLDLSQVSAASTTTATGTGSSTTADASHTDTQAPSSGAEDQTSSTHGPSSDIAAQFAAQVAATLTPAAGSQSNRHTSVSQSEDSVTAAANNTSQGSHPASTNEKAAVGAISDNVSTPSHGSCISLQSLDESTSSSSTTPISQPSSTPLPEPSQDVSSNQASASATEIPTPTETVGKSDIIASAAATSVPATETAAVTSSTATTASVAAVTATDSTPAAERSAAPINTWSQAVGNTANKAPASSISATVIASASTTAAAAATTAATTTVAATTTAAAVIAAATTKTTAAWSTAASQPAKQPAWGGMGQAVKPQGASKPAAMPAASTSVTSVATTSVTTAAAAVSSTTATTASATAAVATTTATSTIAAATATAVAAATTAASATVEAKAQPAPPSGTISYSSVLRTTAPAFQPAAAVAAAGPVVEERVEPSKSGREVTPPSTTGVAASKPPRLQEQQPKSQDEDTSGDVEDEGWIQSKDSRKKKQKQQQKNNQTASAGRGPSSAGKPGGAAFSAPNDMEAVVAKPNDERPVAQSRPALAEHNGVPEPSAAPAERREWGKPGNAKSRDVPAGHRGETKSVERSWPAQRQEAENRGRKGGAQPGAAVAREQSADSARKAASSSDVAKPPVAAISAKPPPMWVAAKPSAAIFSPMPVVKTAAEIAAEKPVVKQEPAARENKPTEGGRGKQVDSVRNERASAERGLPNAATGGKMSYAASTAAAAHSQSQSVTDISTSGTAATTSGKATTGKISYAAYAAASASQAVPEASGKLSYAASAAAPPQAATDSSSANVPKDSKGGPADKSHQPKRKEGLNPWKSSETTRASSEEKVGSYASAASNSTAASSVTESKAGDRAMEVKAVQDSRPQPKVMKTTLPASSRWGKPSLVPANEISSSVDAEIVEEEKSVSNSVVEDRSDSVKDSVPEKREQPKDALPQAAVQEKLPAEATRENVTEDKKEPSGTDEKKDEVEAGGERKVEESSPVDLVGETLAEKPEDKSATTEADVISKADVKPAAEATENSMIEEIKTEKEEVASKSAATTLEKESESAAVGSEADEIKSSSDVRESSPTTDVKSETKDAAPIEESTEKIVTADAGRRGSDADSTDSGKQEEAGRQTGERKEEESQGPADSEGKDSKTATVESGKASELKYEYTEEQWTPLRPEGKKQYDRNFLLALQFVNKGKPTLLPELDCVLQEPRSSNAHTEPPRSSSHEPVSPIDFTPGYVKSAPSGGRGGPRRGGGGGGSMRRDNGPRGDPRSMGGSDSIQRRIINVPLAADIKLHTSENPFKPNPTEKKPVAELNTEGLFKRMRGVLNKLTPQNFDRLLDQVMDLPINTEERLAGCNQIMFEKAIAEPNFSVAYANMAQRLCKLVVPSDEDPTKKVIFRIILLNKCQAEFERDKANETDIAARKKAIDEASPEKKPELIEELDQAVSKAKKRSLGLVTFIGELYKLKMLTEGIMHNCLGGLLKKEEDEESLECLCELLKTIGQDIDAKSQASSQQVDKYMKKLKELVDNQRVSPRIRFMIMNITDQRKNNWVARRENKPKTIEEIHKEAETEEISRQILIQSLDQPRSRGGDNRGNDSRGGQRGGPPPQHNVRPVGASDDGWTNVSRAPRSIVDPAKMKLSKPDENISFGPGGRPFSSWTKGSSGGGSSSSKDTNDRPAHSNRYSALASSESLDSRSRVNRSSPARGSGASGQDYRGRMSGPYNMGGGQGSRQSQERNSGSRPSQERNSGSRDQRYRGSGGSGMGPGSRSGQTSPYNSRSASRENYPRHSGAVSLAPGGAAGSMPPPSMPPPSIVVEREKKAVSSRAVEEASVKDGGVSDEREVETKSKSILEEYLHLRDITEAAACVEEIARQCRHLFVYHSVSQSLESSQVKREGAGVLHAQLLRRGIITPAQYVSGLKEIVDLSDELIIDIANYWMCLAQLMAPVVVVEAGSRGGVSLEALRSSWGVLTADQIGKLIVLILAQAAKTSKEADVSRAWLDSGLKWSDLLSADKLDSLLTEHKVQFLNETAGGAPSAGHSSVTEASQAAPSGVTLERISAELERLLGEGASNDIICDNIEKLADSSTVGSIPFVSALVTSACNMCIKGTRDKMAVDEQLLKDRTALLKKYVTSELEIQALYSLQALMTKLEHPPDVLRTFFNILYDEDIVSEEVFRHWRDSSDPAHHPGKGVAITSVNQFFQFLDSSDS